MTSRNPRAAFDSPRVERASQRDEVARKGAKTPRESRLRSFLRLCVTHSPRPTSSDSPEERREAGWLPDSKNPRASIDKTWLERKNMERYEAIGQSLATITMNPPRPAVMSTSSTSRAAQTSPEIRSPAHFDSHAPGGQHDASSRPIQNYAAQPINLSDADAGANGGLCWNRRIHALLDLFPSTCC